MRRATRSRPGAAVLLAGLTLLAACSGTPGDAGSASPAAPGTDASASPSRSPAASGSASPSLALRPASDCLTGRWRLVRFVGMSAQADQTYGTGQGGDMTVRFGDGTYTLSGAGSEPITVTLAGRSAELRVDGDIEGGWTLDGSTATFTERSASGSATLRAGGQEQALSMDQVANVVGLEGAGEVACTADAMTVTLRTVRLELGRA
jgi:hypothetical protein